MFLAKLILIMALAFQVNTPTRIEGRYTDRVNNQASIDLVVNDEQESRIIYWITDNTKIFIDDRQVRITDLPSYGRVILVIDEDSRALLEVRYKTR